MFLLLCAVVVDVGYWWANAKKAQIAADACALAAAQSIPDTDPPTIVAGDATIDPLTGDVVDKGECVIDDGGPDYVLTNIPEQGDSSPEPLHTLTLVEWPYIKSDGSEDDTMVEATVRMKVGTFFGRVVGLHSIDVERRAVAERSFGVNEVAVHAHDTNCANDSLGLFGKNITIEGVAESNGDFEVNGENIDTGPAAGVHSGSCEIKVDPNKGHSFGGQPKPTHDPVPHPWPFYVVPGEHPFDWPNSCDVVDQNMEFDVPNEVIPDGVYCASESFEVKAEGISGKITVFSPRISVTAKGTRFEPSTRAMDAGKPLLFMTLPNNTSDPGDDDPEPYCQDFSPFKHDMILNAEEITWTGVLFNPCGHIRVNGAKNAALDGMIVAQTVRINGENFNLKKISTIGTNKRLALVE
jgi:hypothetical protein